MKKPYHIVSREAAAAAATVEEFAKANGQILLPLVELITQARVAVDEVIDRIGRQTIETILNLSAERNSRRPHAGQGQRRCRWHGSQNGRVSLADQQIKVRRPRLRHKEDGEVKVPAYESSSATRLGETKAVSTFGGLRTNGGASGTRRGWSWCPNRLMWASDKG